MDARAACHPDVVAVHISAPEKKQKGQTETLDEAQDGLPSIAAVSGSLAAGSASDIVVPNTSQAAGSAGNIVVPNMSLAAGSAGDDIVKMAPPIDFIGKPCGEWGPASSSERAGLPSIVDAVVAERGTSPTRRGVDGARSLHGPPLSNRPLSANEIPTATCRPLATGGAEGVPLAAVGLWLLTICKCRLLSALLGQMTASGVASLSGIPSAA